jgi:hypothetical protein
MTRKNIRKSGAPPRQQWTLENMREAAKRLEQGDTNLREAFRYYGITKQTLNRRLKSGDLTEKKLVPPGRHMSSPITRLRKAFTLTSRCRTSCKYSILCDFRPVWSGNWRQDSCAHQRTGTSLQIGELSVSLLVDLLLSLIFHTNSTTKKK